MRPFSLYIHIPYCLQKCPYCDFNTYALASIPEREYVTALLADLDFRASQVEWRNRPIQSIYFGGGTPSLFSARSVRKVISEACALFPVDGEIEVSLEANPGTVDAEKLGGYEECGINRLSFGAQSLQLQVLRSLGRTHTPEDVVSAVLLAQSVGIQNINLDLMYGAPGQTVDLLREDLNQYLGLAIPHISAYGLTIEKGTPFFTSFRKGLLPLPKEDIVIEMMEEINRALPQAGLQHYEISNFARPGHHARHNLAYWDCNDYLGIGAGAHSCVTLWKEEEKAEARRWSNYALPNRYIKHACSEGKAEGWNDQLGPQELMFEFFFLGLRKIGGVPLAQFEQFFGRSVESTYPTLLQILASEGLVTIEHGYLRLTTRGVMISDSVIEHFASPEMPRYETRVPTMIATPQSA